MSVPVTLEALDLAALLCSRVCHDLISPSGAIVNGLEVLEESTDEETKSFALDLIKKSAKTASARLQFCRLAFGAAGSANAQVDLAVGQRSGQRGERCATRLRQRQLGGRHQRRWFGEQSAESAVGVDNLLAVGGRETAGVGPGRGG